MGQCKSCCPGFALSVCGFGHSALQPFKCVCVCVCVCVECEHTLCAYTMLTFCLHLASSPGPQSSPRSAHWLFCLQWTLVWLFCRKTYLLSSPDPIFALASVETHLSSPHQVGTMVQIMPGLYRIMNTCQVREYLDSTILTMLKWWIITMLNR